jgi:endonuclease YncB( thermonuclease family)
MEEIPPPPRPSRLRAFWSARSRKGKAGIVVGAIILALVAIGYAAPSENNDGTQDIPTTASETRIREGSTVGGTTTETETVEPPPVTLFVSEVIDGDTLDLDNGDRIRLVQIDAPEGKGDCYGKKAGTVLRQLLPVGTEIRLEVDPNLDNEDRYGRLLRYVFNRDQNVNRTLVQKGAASVWYFNGDKGRYANDLLRAAKRARTARRGAWGACEAKLDPMRAFRTQPKRNEPNPVTPAQEGCEPGYSPCLPITGDLDCPDIEAMGLAPVIVTGSDRYRLDGDGDGTGCE